MIRPILSLLVFVASGNTHSWIEQLTVIAPNGTFVGEPGYARGNVLRTAPGFGDPTMVNLIPPSTQPNVSVVLPTTKMCKDTQQTYNQTKGSPRLKASAGAAIALRYQENGHVTLPQNQPGKPENRGSIYVYGTTNPKEGETLLNVHGKWTQDGPGGDGSDVLLSKQSFDDSRCYQINSGDISKSRQQKYPHTANQLMGADLWCQQDIKLPSNLPSGSPYTLYWVWDWPTAAGEAYPNGKQEIYTTCIDIDVEGSSNTQNQKDDAKYIAGQDLNRASIQSQFEELANQQAGSQSGSSSSSEPSTPSSAPSSSGSSAPSGISSETPDSQVSGSSLGPSAPFGAPSSASSASLGVPSEASTSAPGNPPASSQIFTVTITSTPPPATVTVTASAAATTEWKTVTQVQYVCSMTTQVPFTASSS